MTRPCSVQPEATKFNKNPFKNGRKDMVALRVIRTLKIFRIITMILIGLYITTCATVFILLRLTNLSYYVIISGSMKPEINIDDVVVSRNLTETEVAQSLEVGDIATYFDGSSYVTHRVYDKSTDKETNETVFVFKGDNNNTVDRLRIRSNQIRGKQIYTLSNAAWIFEYINSIYGTISLISVLALLFVIENTLTYAINLKLQALQQKNNGETDLSDNLQPSC